MRSGHIDGPRSAVRCRNLPITQPTCCLSPTCRPRYHNAIRECGQRILSPLEPGTTLAYDAAGSYLASVHAAHGGASSALLNYMMRQAQALQWLRSAKHFFLLDQVRKRSGCRSARGNVWRGVAS